MRKRKGRPCGRYESDSFHGFGVHAMQILDERENDGALPAERRLAILGMKLTAYADRLAYAEFDTDGLTGALSRIARVVETDLSRLAAGGDPLVPELRNWHERQARYVELLEEHTFYDYAELLELGEGWINRLIRLKELYRAAGWEDGAWIEEAGRMADALAEGSREMEYLTLRHFYAALNEERYGALSALCLGSRFLEQASRIVRLFVLEEDRPETIEARAAGLAEEYNLEALCALGERFDFRAFDDEQDPLMPEVVDMLFGACDATGEGGIRNG